MLYEAPTGKVHSSEVDHDLCVFIKNNARLNFNGCTLLPVERYQPGNDCVKCEEAIRSEIDEHEYDYGDAEDEGDDEFVIDSERKTEAEAKYGIRDAEKAIDNWMAIGGDFWENKAQSLLEEIRFVAEDPEEEASASVDPIGEEASNLTSEDANQPNTADDVPEEEAEEASPAPVKRAPRKRTTAKK
ncbi:hypothetical protein ACFYZH_09965 [Streptomyces abikoensis]|uniref:hypothetical protein n=1 Tax=Streptomyces abikoensis TaxID=97398 RepID=UPI0036A243B6